MMLGCIVIAWFIIQAYKGAWDQTKTEARRAAANFGQQVHGRMAAGWDKGPMGSGWFWAALAHKVWRALTEDGRAGGGTTSLPHSTPWRRIAGAGWARGQLGARTARRRLQARQAAGNLTPAAALAGLLALLAAMAGFAAFLAPGRGTRPPRQKRRRRKFQMGRCDDCELIYAANALRLVHQELRGTAGWWLLCPGCRGDVTEPRSEELPPPGGDPGTPDTDTDTEPGTAAEPEAGQAPEPGLVPAGWTRRPDGRPETPADTRLFDLRDVIGWRGWIGQDGLPGGEGAGEAQAELERLAAEIRPYLLTVRRADGAPVIPGSPDAELTLGIWSAEDLDRRLELIGQDPALEASVAVPLTARPKQQPEQQQSEQQQSGEPDEGEPEMANGTVASGGDAITHGQWAAAVADIGTRLAELPAQIDKMYSGLTTVEAGPEQINGVIGLGAACGLYQQQITDMFTQVHVKEMPVVEAYAAAGGVANAPVPGYFAEN